MKNFNRAGRELSFFEGLSQRSKALLAPPSPAQGDKVCLDIDFEKGQGWISLCYSFFQSVNKIELTTLKQNFVFNAFGSKELRSRNLRSFLLASAIQKRIAKTLQGLKMSPAKILAIAGGCTDLRPKFLSDTVLLPFAKTKGRCQSGIEDNEKMSFGSEDKRIGYDKSSGIEDNEKMSFEGEDKDRSAYCRSIAAAGPLTFFLIKKSAKNQGLDNLPKSKTNFLNISEPFHFLDLFSTKIASAFLTPNDPMPFLLVSAIKKSRAKTLQSAHAEKDDLFRYQSKGGEDKKIKDKSEKEENVAIEEDVEVDKYDEDTIIFTDKYDSYTAYFGLKNGRSGQEWAHTVEHRRARTHQVSGRINQEISPRVRSFICTVQLLVICFFFLVGNNVIAQNLPLTEVELSMDQNHLSLDFLRNSVKLKSYTEDSAKILKRYPKANLIKYPSILYDIDGDAVDLLNEGEVIPDYILDMPLWVLNYPDSVTDVITLRELGGKEFILLEFWNTHCKPCLESVIEWENTPSSLKSDVYFLGIAVDQSYRVPIEIGKRHWTSTHVIGRSAFALSKFFFNDFSLGPLVWIKGGKLFKTVAKNGLKKNQLIFQFFSE